MYKLLLVDDEEPVRKAIINKIEWEAYGFQVVGEADNGKTALELIEKTTPDVVITDIKMPYMDGIELAKELKQRFSGIKVVFLTGFDEFEYAQKAINLTVIEYILKPISADELMNILINIKNKIDSEVAQKEDIEALKKHYRDSLPILKEKFLASLVNGKIGNKEIKHKINTLGLKLNGGSYLVSIIEMDISSHVNNENSYSFRLPDEMELLQFAVLNITNEILNNNDFGVAFMINENIAIIGVEKEDDREKIIDRASFILDEIRQKVKKYLGYTITIGVGTASKTLEEIHLSYKNALSALEYKVVMGNDKIIVIEDVEPESADKIIFDENKEQRLISVIKVGTTDEIHRCIDKLFEEISNKKATVKDYQVYIMEIITTIFKAAKSVNVEISTLFGQSDNLFSELNRFNELNEIKDIIKNICCTISQNILEKRQETFNQLVFRAKVYIKENYSDSEMSINKVCSYLHISAPYFSSIFKKETKTTFINYLTQVRMEAAKDLLKNTDLKTFEIAEKVGFSDSNYFSYSFKKNYGISPSEYRNK